MKTMRFAARNASRKRVISVQMWRRCASSHESLPAGTGGASSPSPDGLAIFLNTFVSLLFCHPPLFFSFFLFFLGGRSLAIGRPKGEERRADSEPGVLTKAHANALGMPWFSTKIISVNYTPPHRGASLRRSAAQTDPPARRYRGRTW